MDNPKQSGDMTYRLLKRARLKCSPDGKSMLDPTGSHPNWCIWLLKAEGYLLQKHPVLEPLRVHVYVPREDYRYVIYCLQRDGYRIKITQEQEGERYTLMDPEQGSPPPPSKDFDIRILFVVDNDGMDVVDVEFGCWGYSTLTSVERDVLGTQIEQDMMCWLLTTTKGPEPAA